MTQCHNFHNTGPKKSLDTRVESNLQKSMLVPVNYDDPVKQVTHPNNILIWNCVLTS